MNKHLEVAAEALSHKPRKAAKSKKAPRPKEMHLKEAESGGYIVSHHSGEGDKPAEHVMPDMAALHQHIDDQWGQPADAAEPEEAQQ